MFYKASLIIFLSLQSFFTVAYSAPAQIVIIRHGEKPATGNELNEQGWKRANALVSFFGENKIINEFGTPIAVYAGAPNKPGASIRSIQTITPTAKNLGLEVHQSITKDQIDLLVNEVMNTKEYDNHTVLICWEHSVIPDMAHLFGATDAPDTWDSNVFDRAWIIRYTDGQVSSFQNIAQHLLPGDSAN